MKNPDATHCSDECLLAEIKDSESKRDDGKGIESWKERTDPWE